jgi:tetratricopeptide (TPR) repeat protein
MADHPGPTGPERFSTTQLAAAVFLAAVLVFSGTLGHDLVWDDVHIIHYGHQVIRDTGPVGLLTTPFIARPDDPSDSSGYYRPVSFISMWINDPVGEPSPFLYHLVNVGLHGINTVLVFLLFRLLLPNGMGALFGSLLFAVHPVHAESVAFVSGRTDLLAALFTLLSVILWLRFRRGPATTHRRRWPWYLAGMISFTLACLAKEVAFVLPAVALAWTLVFRTSSDEKGASRATRDLPWIFGWFAVLGLVIYTRFALLGIGFGPDWSSSALGMDNSLLSMAGDAVVNVAVYLRLMLFPWPLAVYYPPVPMEFTPLILAAGGGFAALCLSVASKRHSYVGYLALVWVLAFLAPVSGVVGLGLSIIAERFCYLPSVGVALAVGYAMDLFRSRVTVRHLHTATFSVLLLLLGLGAVLHSGRWRDEVTLFSHAVDSGKASVANMHFNLGNALVEAGRPREGIEAFEEAIRLHPSYIGAMLNLASTHMKLDEHERALTILLTARKLSPADPRLWANTGVALDVLGRAGEALDAYNRAAELDPADPLPGVHSGNLLSRLGRYDESAEAYRGVLLVDPNNFGALVGLGRSLENLSRFPEAAETYLKAMEGHPEQVVPYLGLGRVLLGQGKPMEAGAVYRAALKVAPSDPLAHRGVIIAAVQEGNREGAAAHIVRMEQTDQALAGDLAELLQQLDGGEERQ